MESFLTIGERLALERKRLGYAQTQFGELVGVSKVTQGKYEKNETSPTADYLARVGELGVDVMFVLTGRRLDEPRKAFTPVDDAARTALAERGLHLVQEAAVSEVRISLLGLHWLAELQSTNSKSLLHWDTSLVDALVELAPPNRGLNVQSLTLRPYGTKQYSQLVFYLDRSPPASLFWVAPSLVLKARYELDVQGTNWLTFGAEETLPPPVLVLNDEERNHLAAGEICRSVLS